MTIAYFATHKHVFQYSEYTDMNTLENEHDL